MTTVTIVPDHDLWNRGEDLSSHANAVAANGSLTADNAGTTSWVTVTSYYCARTYYRFDTTSIPKDATISSAYIQVYMSGQRGGTDDAVEVHKICKSSEIGNLGNNNDYYQTITSDCADTSTDVGTSLGNKQFTIDGDVLTYLQEQVTAGNKSAFHLRNAGDFNVGLHGDPSSGISTRTFLGTGGATAPFISITYSAQTTYTTDNHLVSKSGILIFKDGITEIK